MTAHDRKHSSDSDLAMARFRRDDKENWPGFLNALAREIAGRRDNMDVRIRTHHGRLELIVKERTQ